ncbi:MAG: heterocyst frequency control protein PatD [Leptolyngbya sp.]|nr:heterocyst frequency control protein PatD [Leptolyngbya sp.]
MSRPSQVFQDHLDSVSALCHQANPDPRALQGQFLALQQTFQREVLPLSLGHAAHLQPLLTEMNRALRLIAMDVAFLQTARQPQTRHQRQHQMLARLTQLATFTATLDQSLNSDQV